MNSESVVVLHASCSCLPLCHYWVTTCLLSYRLVMSLVTHLKIKVVVNQSAEYSACCFSDDDAFLSLCILCLPCCMQDLLIQHWGSQDAVWCYRPIWVGKGSCVCFELRVVLFCFLRGRGQMFSRFIPSFTEKENVSISHQNLQTIFSFILRQMNNKLREC